MTYFNKIKMQLADSASVDSFARLRISQPHILSSFTFSEDDLPLSWDGYEVGSATVSRNSDRKTMILNVTAADGDHAINQTKHYWLYRAGQGQSIRLTFAEFDQVENVIKRVGYFDDYDGVFVESTGDDIAIVLRSSITGSAVDTRITQENWNVDTFDGNGSSGVVADWTKSQHLEIDLQFLGVGRVRVGFDIAGSVIYAHEFLFSNSIDTSYMTTAKLPLRYEIKNIAASSGANLEQICSTVMREGGLEEEGIITYADTPLITPLTATTTLRTILSIRLRDSHIRAFLKPLKVIVSNLGTEDIKWFFVLNPTVTGTFTWSNHGTASQISRSQLTYTNETGHILGGNISVATNQQNSISTLDINSLVGVAASIEGTSDIVSVIVQSSTGTVNCVSGVQWIEVF